MAIRGKRILKDIEVGSKVVADDTEVLGEEKPSLVDFTLTLSPFPVRTNVKPKRPAEKNPRTPKRR